MKAQSSAKESNPSLKRALIGRRIVFFGGFTAIAAQRISVPVGEQGIQVASLILFAMFVLIWISGRAVAEPKALTFPIAIGATGAVALMVGLAENPFGLTPSISSLFLLLAIYLPTALRPSTGDSEANLGLSFFDGCLTAIKLGGVLAFVQWGLQKLGFGYVDPVALLPTPLQTPGFNSHYDTQYVLGGAKGVFKPNGLIYLEPSFLSLYSALGALICLHFLTSSRRLGLRRDASLALWTLVLVGAVAISASTTGVLVFGIGIVFLAFRLRRNKILVALMLLVGVALLAVGLFDILISKAQEGFVGDTSTALRLVTPYSELLPDWLAKPFLGWGPGTANTLALKTGITGLQVPTLLKCLLEYGLVGVIPLVAMVWSATARSTAPQSLVAAVLAAYLLPSEALLNATLVAMLIFAIPFWHSDKAATNSALAKLAPGEHVRPRVS